MSVKGMLTRISPLKCHPLGALSKIESKQNGGEMRVAPHWCHLSPSLHWQVWKWFLQWFMLNLALCKWIRRAASDLGVTIRKAFMPALQMVLVDFHASRWAACMTCVYMGRLAITVQDLKDAVYIHLLRMSIKMRWCGCILKLKELLCFDGPFDCI